MLTTATGQGQMKTVRLGEIETASRHWLDAIRSGRSVQFWDLYEQTLCDFFGMPQQTRNVMMGVLMLSAWVCHGNCIQVKAVLRIISPDSLNLACLLLGHIPQFDVVMRAERDFRNGLLAGDWTMFSDGDGKVIVRSEHGEKMS